MLDRYLQRKQIFFPCYIFVGIIMGSKLSTERNYNENGIGEIENIQGNSNITNTVSNNIQTIHNEYAIVETQTIVQGSSNTVSVNIHNPSTKEPELDDYNFPKPIDSFKGREGEFKQLDDYLFLEDNKMVVIWGLPGFGKSELLKHFAHKCKLKSKIKYICWIEATNKNILEHSLKNLAEILNLPKVDGRALMQKVGCRHQDSGTLFLFDDVESPRSLLDWETPRGCWTLVSSQCGTWGTKPRIEVGPLELEAAVSVLQHLQDPAVTADRNLYTLAKLLDKAPIALQLAAAYIRQEMMLFPEKFNVLKYIKKLEKSREKFVNELLPADTFLPYQYSIQAAMSLSIEKIRNLGKFESDLALDILNISAYLYPNSISEKLLLKFSFIQNKLKEAEDEDDEDDEQDPEMEMRRALYVLQNYAFVHLEDVLFRIHSLVQHSLLFHHNKINVGNEALYTSCLEFVLNSKYNWHSDTILRQADKNLGIFKKFYEEYKSKIIDNNKYSNYNIKVNNRITLENNKDDAHKKILLLAPKVYNYCEYGDVKFESKPTDEELNFIKVFSTKSFLQRLVIAGAKKCLVSAFEELGSSAKEAISEHRLLVSAFQSQQVDIIKLLQRYGEDINKIVAGSPAIHVAVCTLNIENLNFLLKNTNIDVNARNEKGDTCICSITVRYFSINFDFMQNVLYDRMCTLIAHGACVYNVTKSGYSLLHVAVRKINTAMYINRMEFIMDKLQVDVNTQDINGMTALHFIIYRREMHDIDDELTSKLVDVLLKRGANIHVKDIGGYSPLDAVKKYKFHFLLPILESNNTAGSFHILHHAVSILNLDIINVLLDYNNTDVNARDDNGFTCICKAFFSFFAMELDTGDKICHVIRTLVDRGASIYNVSNYGCSLLHVAVESIKTAKGLKVVEFIVDELHVDVNTRNNCGRTALHCIPKRREMHEIDDELTSKLVDILVKRGANIVVNDGSLHNFFDAIKKYEFRVLLPILESNGVYIDL